MQEALAGACGCRTGLPAVSTGCTGSWLWARRLCVPSTLSATPPELGVQAKWARAFHSERCPHCRHARRKHGTRALDRWLPSVAPEPAISASPGNLLGMHIPAPPAPPELLSRKLWGWVPATSVFTCSPRNPNAFGNHRPGPVPGDTDPAGSQTHFENHCSRNVSKLLSL